MLIIALLSAACGAHAAEERLTIASTFRPWALNDSQAFVFPRIAEKRNRGRRERLASRGSPPRYAAEYVALIDAVRRAWLKRALGAGHSGTGRTFDEG